MIDQPYVMTPDDRVRVDAQRALQAAYIERCRLFHAHRASVRAEHTRAVGAAYGGRRKATLELHKPYIAFGYAPGDVAVCDHCDPQAGCDVPKPAWPCHAYRRARNSR